MKAVIAIFGDNVDFRVMGIGGSVGKVDDDGQVIFGQADFRFKRHVQSAVNNIRGNTMVASVEVDLTMTEEVL